MLRPAHVLLFVLCWALPVAVAGQTAPQGRPGASAVRLHVGMWTTHLTRLGGGLDANWLVAVGWRGLFGGTFVNSFGDRGFAAGIERPLARRDAGRMPHGVGYRLGVVTGYDERLAGLAGWMPVLPALQVTGDLAVGRTGVELSWAGKTASMSPFMRMGR